jgi:predicted nucleotidyltransferase
MSAMPEVVVELVDELMTMSGAVAVALGGSRALGTGDDQSDWDLGVYYRGAIDLSKLAARGHLPRKRRPSLSIRSLDAAAVFRRRGSLTVPQSGDNRSD